MIPLPFMPFSGTGGEALNDNGAVAGGIANPDGSVSLATWADGVLTDLGTPPGVPHQDFDRPRVFGMNRAGAIVGTVHTAAGDLPSRWFIYERGCFTVLPLPDPTDLGGGAIGINSRGEVVGYHHTARNTQIGWSWRDGRYTRLPVAGINTVALGINSSGAIIGNRSLGLARRLLAGEVFDKGERGYVLDRGTVRFLPGFVYAINDLGEAAGGSRTRGNSLATVFRGGRSSVIVNSPSYAVGINGATEVVGFYQPAGHAHRRLFMWSDDCGALDLTPAGYRRAEAAAINNRGDVLGFGETLAGRSEYFLLTPAEDGVLAPAALLGTPAAP
ncbi:MAG: hypothetical protein JSS29_14380 [Proteobacteria bacterium]|nr:hypothetical protein [Pseudomonadota bacterium]